MLKLFTTSALLVGVVSMSACGTPPKRTPYAGPDQVGAIEPAQLVGKWKMSVLNPVGEENASTVTHSFNRDGTWVSTVIPPQEQTEQFGPLQYRGNGAWQVNGDSILSNLENMEETTGNKFGAIMQAVASAFMPKTTTANVYEISESRIVFVYEETGTATLLERL